jgi:hypothetical protein
MNRPLKRPFGLKAVEIATLIKEAMQIVVSEQLHIAFAAREVMLRKFNGKNKEDQEILVDLILEGSKMFVGFTPTDVSEATRVPQATGFIAKTSEAYEQSRETSASSFEVYSVTS